jgi:uncharacterized RDD family membrane protein YckC
MITIDEYIREVRRGIVASPEKKKKLEEDLRAHFDELRATGMSAGEALGRMGTPDEVAMQFMEETPKEYGGFFTRLLAFFADAGLVAAAIMPVGFFAMLLMVWSTGFIDNTGLQNAGDSPVRFALALGSVFIASILLISVMAVGLLYFPFFERIRGATPGKSLLGLHVLKEDGRAIGWKEAFIRRIPFYFEITVLDAIFIPFNERRQRAFDMVAKTVVLREERHDRSALYGVLAVLLVIVPFVFLGLLYLLFSTNAIVIG